MGRLAGVGVAISLVPVNSFLAINISFSEMLMALNLLLGRSPRRTCHLLLGCAGTGFFAATLFGDSNTGTSSCTGGSAKI